MMMIVTFSEINFVPNESLTYSLVRGEAVNSAVEYIMQVCFPEFDESDIFSNGFDSATVDLNREIVAVTINPVWLEKTQH